MKCKPLKISFCIVCMNRLHQLRETLIQNIKDNEDYPELEFIVLDYNSQDGMAEWIKKNVNEFISNKRLIYYRTNEPLSFSHSHSKNLAFNLANGDIVCNINADHYTGKGFAHYINERFNEDNNCVLTTIDFYKTNRNYNPSKDVFGRVCVKKSDFLKIKGFDERMNRYGFEDWDFINRLELMGVKRVLIGDFKYLKFISHGEEERFSLNVDHLESFYVNYITPSISEVLFFLKDRSYERGILIDNSTINSEDYKYASQIRNCRFEYTVQDPGWETGHWDLNLNNYTLSLISDKGSETKIGDFKKELNDNDYFEIKDNRYFRLTEASIIQNLLEFNYLFYNRSLMEKNLETNTPIVNKNFGEAIVFKNFKSGQPIYV